MAKKKTRKTIDTDFGNYSSSLIMKFKELGLSLGDRISIRMDSKFVEGNLLAQSELGKHQNILLKMENGYNVGIKVDNSVEIKKLRGQVDLDSFAIRVPPQKKNLPLISLLSTGGTIASRIDYQTGGVVMAMEPEEIFATLPELFDEVSFKGVKSLFTLASEDLASEQWKKMAESASDELNSEINGVVISHGTDTMGYSSAALSFMLGNLNKPVVLTGAQRSSDRGSFDGALNLISAARIAAKADIASVVVVMHETSDDEYAQVSRGTRVRKMHTTRRDAFRTINDKPLARIDSNGEITELQTDLPRKFEGSVELNSNYDDKVALIKIFPGISPKLIDFYVDQGYRGLILEGTGLGHIPTFPPEENRNMLKPLQRAIEDGVVVGMTSQCLNGRVHPFVYRATRTSYTSGIIYLEDMLPETALVKLGWTLGNFEDDEVKEKMLHNFAGEISDRSYYRKDAL